MEPIHVHEAAILKAFANPLRLRLLDMLRAGGPATVGMLSERADEAVGSVSHHLKILASADLIELAPELARDRRERWWRASSASRRWRRDDLDAEAASSALAAEELILERQTHYARRSMHAHDPGWHSFSTSSWLRLTPDQLVRLGEEIVGLIARYADTAETHPDPAAEPVLIFARGLHVEP